MEKKPYQFRVTALRRTTPSVVVVTLTPVENGIFPFTPGQFVMLQLFNPNATPWRQKAYSMCSTPNQTDSLEFGLKVMGEFTQHVAALKVGDRVDVRGPYGVFTLQPNMNDVVFLAGGIGITPFLSIIRNETEAQSPRNLTLLYANRTRDDIAFLPELLSLAERNPRLRICFFLESGELPTLPVTTVAGRVTVEILKQMCPTLTGKYFFLCGPPPFMDAMLACLTEQGVNRDMIKIEKFGGGRERPVTQEVKYGKEKAKNTLS